MWDMLTYRTLNKILPFCRWHRKYILFYFDLNFTELCIEVSTQVLVNNHYLILNVQGPSCHGLTSSISLLLMPWLLGHQAISSHDINYVNLVPVGIYLTWRRISVSCVMSMLRNDINCKYIFMFLLKNLASLELMASCNQTSHSHHLNQ